MMGAGYLRLVWLAVLPVVFAADWALTARHRLADLAAEREWRVTTARAGGEALRYAHADWQIVGARMMTIATPDPRIIAGPGARVVVVRATVTGAADAPAPAEADLDDILGGGSGGGWGDCRAALIDAEGRRWASSMPIADRALRRDMSPAGKITPGCAQMALRPPGPGETLAFEDVFVIPANAAAPLSLRISTAMAGRPRAIQLELATTTMR